MHGLRQGATVQGVSCGPPAHSGTMEACWGVLEEDGWLRDRRLGSNSSGPRKGEALGAPGRSQMPQGLGQRSASGVYRGP